MTARTTRKSAAKPAAKKPAAKKSAAPANSDASDARKAAAARAEQREANRELHGEFAVDERAADRFVVTLKNGGGRKHDVYEAKNANYAALVVRALSAGLATRVAAIRNK